MPNFLAGAESLISSFRDKLGDEITVTFGEAASDPFYATIIEEERPIDESNGQFLHWVGIAVQFDVADLVLNGAVTEPAVGMRIERTVGGQTLTYEVNPPNENQAHFNYFPGRTRAVMYAVQVTR